MCQIDRTSYVSGIRSAQLSSGSSDVASQQQMPGCSSGAAATTCDPLVDGVSETRPTDGDGMNNGIPEPYVACDSSSLNTENVTWASCPIYVVPLWAARLPVREPPWP